ncbi:hypothetical protein L1987_45675 [Smallanthus sonchifolius]|uniref:Uncharacterized protein n=1 Tax=Smallanthus sonchifolius TaxID=185202 RepID=A0ACB9FYL7_9ASTR|nr:hypothetical protein L1987_45675 [Smallanthus sonchifolius]
MAEMMVAAGGRGDIGWLACQWKRWWRGRAAVDYQWRGGGDEGGGDDGGRSCLYAFLVADNSYVRNLISGQSFDGKVSSIPTVLRWRLAHNDFSEASCTYNFSRHELHIGENTSHHTWKCNCLSEFEEGNPYLSGGCKGNAIS